MSGAAGPFSRAFAAAGTFEHWGLFNNLPLALDSSLARIAIIPLIILLSVILLDLAYPLGRE